MYTCIHIHYLYDILQFISYYLFLKGVFTSLLRRVGLHLRGLGVMLTFMGNHLSNTTCLTQVLFKRGESFGKPW